MRLYSYVIRGTLLQWLREFLTGRTHQTRVGFLLSCHTAPKWVVQGSGIRPLLFLSYINELAEILGRAGINVKLFADDIRLYMQIVNSCDTAKLQYALDLVTEWAKAWQLALSINKCCILSIGRIPPAASADLYIESKKNVARFVVSRSWCPYVTRLKANCSYQTDGLIGISMC